MLGLLSTPPLVAQSAGREMQVWVNVRSRIYHCPDSDQYGRTQRGAYLTEGEAQARGYRPRGGRRCDGTRVLDSERGDTTAVRLAHIAARQLPDRSPEPPVDRLERCTVAELDDGDTLTCSSGMKVRFIGLDTPERGQAPFGAAATAALAALVPLGAEVWLEGDVEPEDRYGRRLAYVWFDGVQVNWQLIRQGWAVSYPYGATQRYTEALDAAEVRAREEGRGLWRLDGFRCRPAFFRRGQC